MVRNTRPGVKYKYGNIPPRRFYCNMLNKSNWSQRMCEIANQYQLTQHIKKPTRITNNSTTCIYLLYSSHPEKISQAGVVTTGFSDHDMPFVVRKSIIAVSGPATSGNHSWSFLVNQFEQCSSRLCSFGRSVQKFWTCSKILCTQQCPARILFIRGYAHWRHVVIFFVAQLTCCILAIPTVFLVVLTGYYIICTWQWDWGRPEDSAK